MSDLVERLEGALRPPDAPQGPDAVGSEGWSITGLETAAWASRKAAAARRKALEVQEWLDREVARLRDVALTEMVRFEEDAAFFEHHLAAYLAAEIKAGRKTKSLDLPGGTIKLTARQPRVDVEPEAFLAWAVEHRPDLVRLKQEVDRAGLKRAATLAEDGVVVLDGEVVPGASWEAQEDSASFVVAPEVAS